MEDIRRKYAGVSAQRGREGGNIHFDDSLGTIEDRPVSGLSSSFTGTGDQQLDWKSRLASIKKEMETDDHVQRLKQET